MDNSGVTVMTILPPRALVCRPKRPRCHRLHAYCFLRLCVVSLALIPAVGVLPLTTDDQSWHEEHSGSASLTNAEQHSLPGNKIDCHTMEERLHRVRRQLPASTESANVQIIYVTLVIMMTFYITAVVVAVIVGICLCRLYQRIVEAAEMPYWKTVNVHNGDLSSSDKFTFGPASRKLAYSAQMYHYEQQKRRIIEEEKAASQSAAATDIASDEESNGGSYVIYEYPGLASTEELEVQNPLFDEDLLVARSPDRRMDNNNEEERKSDKARGPRH